MNSIASFVRHLAGEREPFSCHAMAKVLEMDGKLLDVGIIRRKDFPLFPFSNGEEFFAWMVVFCEQPYAISGFYFEPGSSLVVIDLIEIKEGIRLAEKKVGYQMTDFGEAMRLANCTVTTSVWLNRNKATQRILERIKKVAP